MSTQKVKGSVLKSRLAFVENEFGREGLEKVMEALDPEDRQTLNSILPVAWLDFEVGKRLDDAIVKVLGGGRSEVFERLGVASAETNLKTVHAAFLSPGDPHAFLAKAPAQIVEKERVKLSDRRDRLSRLEETLAQL